MASTSPTLSMLPARRLPSGSGRVRLTCGTAFASTAPFGRIVPSALRRATWSRPEAERRAVTGIRLPALRDSNRALDERSGDLGLLAAPPDPFRQQLVRGGRGWLLRQPVVVHVGKQGPDAMRRDRVLISRQRSRDPVSGQPLDRLAARLTAVTPRVPVAERLRHDLGRGGMITVRAALVRPLVTPRGHRVGHVVEAAVDAEQVIGVTARLISAEWPVRRRGAAHQEAELR